MDPEVLLRMIWDCTVTAVMCPTLQVLDQPPWHVTEELQMEAVAVQAEVISSPKPHIEGKKGWLEAAC